MPSTCGLNPEFIGLLLESEDAVKVSFNSQMDFD